MLRTDLERLRVLSLLEGVSYLLLLGVAMPLKYLAEMPGAVHYVGWAHGVLFIALGLALLMAWWRVPLGLGLCVGVFVAALLPFGPFVADRWLKEKAHAR
ncbi:MAG: DUF3817 domain-containing protein [Planctomycetota bacterium]